MTDISYEVEGELKRNKNFFSSRKDFYKLNKHIMLIKKINKSAEISYKPKFDLTLYNVRLSARSQEKFYLEPNETASHLSLNKIEFKAKNPEDRARWYLAITNAQKVTQLQNMSFISSQPAQKANNHVEYGKDMSISEIAGFLMNEDEQLQKKITESHSAFEQIKILFSELQDLVKLKQLNPKVSQIITTAGEFINQQEQSLIFIRHVTKRLFELTEQLASKEIEQDPKGFIIRENIQRQSVRKSGILNQFNRVSQQTVAEEFGGQIIQTGTEMVFYEEFKQQRMMDEVVDIDQDDEDQFQDAVEQLHASSFMPSQHFTALYQSARMSVTPSSMDQLMIEQGTEDDEPLEREELPWLKDPNAKISLWAIIKDSIGKGDLSKMSVPVYFNDPTSLLQKCAQSMEYNEILDEAALEKDSMRRLALVAIHQISALSIAERIVTKPFNPLLGETFELKTDKFEYLAEQVSHHPPIAACYCRGKNYTFYTCQKTNTSFNGKMLKITSQYRVYVHFDTTDETFELIMPVLSAHNLIIGQMYIDVGESMTVINQNRPNEKCEVRFERRGWFSSEAFKLNGECYTEEGKQKEISYKIDGRWDKSVSLTNLSTKETQVVWQKKPYPEKSSYMYGMSKFHIQMNYFPKRLQNVVAPTDTRRRQDQRALENGDMKSAALEKERLENRQRTFRKYNEALGKHHEPRYFTKYRNLNDDQDYWKYNNLYFEKDRLNQDWSSLPDIFSYDFSDEVKPYIVGKYNESK